MNMNMKNSFLDRNASLLAHTARGSEEDDMLCDTNCGNGYSSVSI